ncbi:MAG: DMT family transporter [Bifidobacterium catenulatum]
MAKQTSGQASQSQKTSESQKNAKKTAKKMEHVLEQTPKSLLIGTGMTLLGGAMWGMNSTVAKLLMRDYQLDPVWLSCVRALFASLIFLVGSAITTPQKLAGAVKDAKSYPKYLVTTLICVLLVQVSYLMTIDWTNSGTATVLQTLNLVFVLTWVCLRVKRLPLKRELVGVLLAFAGTFLIATGGNFASLSLPWQGLAWGLIDAVSTAAMSILPVMLMLKWGNMTINGITFLMSGLILCPFAQPWANIPALDARGVLLLLYTIVCGTFLAFWLYMAGVMRVGAVRATMLGTSEPVMATITAVAWAGETFTFTDLTGFAMIIIMVFLVR